MRIALVYPPPWKIAGPEDPQAQSYGEDGPPPEYKQGDLDADFYQTPYGLFALGAQALRAGHQVKVLNLSGFAWAKVEEIVANLDADVWGMSCWTANRRGVRMVSEAIKRRHPRSHVVVGGPHATPLGPELLRHYEHVDTVCVGESDVTFLEIVSRLAKGESTAGIAGSVYRDPAARDTILEGPERKNVADLDDLASPHEYFDTHIMMTSLSAHAARWLRRTRDERSASPKTSSSSIDFASSPHRPRAVTRSENVSLSSTASHTSLASRAGAHATWGYERNYLTCAAPPPS